MPLTSADFTAILADLDACWQAINAAPSGWYDNAKLDPHKEAIHKAKEALKDRLCPSCVRTIDGASPDIEDSELSEGAKEQLDRVWRCASHHFFLATIATARGRREFLAAIEGARRAIRKCAQASRPRRRRGRVPELYLLALEDRTRLSWSQEEWAEFLGCDQSAVSRSLNHKEYGPRIRHVYEQQRLTPPTADGVKLGVRRRRKAPPPQDKL
jgi:hypothetical protein